METPLLEKHQAAKATLATFHDCVLPEIFSKFEDEYRAASESVAIFDTNWHAIIELSGPDRSRYLNAIVSNDVKNLGEGHGLLALLLDPKGHILAELEIYALKNRLLTLFHASLRHRTVETLDKYIIMDDVTLEDVTDKLGSFAIEGPFAAKMLDKAYGINLEEFADLDIRSVHIDSIPCEIIRRSHFGYVGAEIIAPRKSLIQLWDNLLELVRLRGGQPIGMKTLESLRLEAGIPFYPADFNDTVIPHEAAVETTHISFSKGCYTGQEIVERVRSRGQVNRRRVRLKFSTPEAPPPGTRLSVDGKELGLVTSSAFSPQENAAIGMGYSRREHNAPGAILDYDGGTAEVVG
ncbi:MAG TPA: glycine cleavage T C-terminal barrel domain-containing protein [Candidatus Acidoferrales bacterium]